MTIIPTYEDLSANLNMKKGQLPFYIGIHKLRSTKLHHHDFVEFAFVIQGSGTETVNGKKHQLRPGVASFLLPHHMHEIHSDSEQPVSKYCCMFDVNILFGSSYDSDWCGLLYEIGSQYPSFNEFAADDAKWLNDILGKLLAESTKPPLPGRSSMIRAMLTEVLLLFVRAVSNNKQAVADSREPEMKQPFWPILQYMHVHYTGKLSLESVAEYFNVSAPYISRIFKHYTGKSFLGYLHQLRIDSAVNLLISTSMPIIDVAAETGFESFRTFSRVFQNLKEVTPREFRNMHGRSAKREAQS
ncbi:AraC family transcriptional regulator [Paenibacillus eucommiae]|uniref:AraC-like DNA-binding protein/mannose-6-phosphate isomerase-like protein (Cupin superfamily) n=1 Tax=Paenibacillus eucommiae TaxID=1355755 RepID=A0ABS4IN16_9BACL|nr:AraC family transcriptional regulator [Paenibacillus eucommiae]MBP1988426.1 AraC-like DNA-binding protein/mannose-6-phosphate isomerase-like protein (cupin superfamily) [Paenibacillus eucommiae]